MVSNHGPRAVHLTRRELGVLGLVAEGLENKQIAATLGISVDTVKGHVSRILAKLGVQNRAAAAAWFATSIADQELMRGAGR